MHQCCAGQITGARFQTLIYLVGTYHELQHTGAPRPDGPPAATVEETRRRFRAHLEHKVAELEPSLIGEEFLRSVHESTSLKSIVKCIADKFGIEHRFCDLEPVLLEPRQEDGEREANWMERIRDRLDSTVLFVCGAKHIESFGPLLRSSGCATDVLHECFGREIYTEG